MRSNFVKILFCLALLTLSLRADLDFTLTPAVRSGVGTNEVVFIGILSNTSPSVNLFLNDVKCELFDQSTNVLSAGTNTFFANVPGVLLPGEVYQDVVFSVVLDRAARPGDYLGKLTILGGADISATNDLLPGNFKVTLPAATLSTTLSGTNVSLSWPAPPGGFVLQQNAIAASTNWVAATNAPVTSNLLYQVIISSTNTSQFFRLEYSPAP